MIIILVKTETIIPNTNFRCEGRKKNDTTIVFRGKKYCVSAPHLNNILNFLIRTTHSWHSDYCYGDRK